MSNPSKEEIAAEAAGAVLTAAGWPWRVAKRKKHTVVVARLPNGKEHTFIVSGAGKDGSASRFAEWQAHTLLRQHGKSIV